MKRPTDKQLFELVGRITGLGMMVWIETKIGEAPKPPIKEIKKYIKEIRKLYEKTQ